MTTRHVSSAPALTPVVLTGGRSRRFGRDKLLEPIHAAFPIPPTNCSAAPADVLLIDRPLAALRGAFAAPVAAAGSCDARVAARFDRLIDDRYPGTGPIGGVLSALEACGTDIFVLPGDLPAIDAETVLRIASAAEHDQHQRGPAAALAVLASARTGEFEPCVGLYRAPSAHLLREQLARGSLALRQALPFSRLLLVAVNRSRVANVNGPEDLSV